MELELYKENIFSSFPSAKVQMEVLTEGDAIVPDTKPDILNILDVCCRCILEKKDVQKGRVVFTGSADFQILYRPEGEDTVKALTAKLPFNHINDIQGITPETETFACCKVVHTECNLFNSRKVSLKAVISIDFTAYTTENIAVVTDISAPDVQMKREKIGSTYIAASGTEEFSVSDTLIVPSGQSEIGELLRCCPEIIDKDIKIVAGKAVLKGAVKVFQLYAGEDGTLQSMEHELPFTEIIDVPGLTEDMVCRIYLCLGAVSCHDDINMDGERRVISFGADIKANVLAFADVNLSVVEDAFIPGKTVGIASTNTKKSEIIDERSEALTLKDTAVLPSSMPPMEQVCLVNSEAMPAEINMDKGRITVNGMVLVHVLYFTAPGFGPIASFTHELPYSQSYECPSEDISPEYSAEVTHTDYNFLNPAQLDLRCILNSSLTLRMDNGEYKVINSASSEEAPPPERASIVIYFVQSGDTLWSIAKRYNTTLESILAANDINEDDIINVGMRLLIPR
ncbi:MAG: DUF3794 domain-containing protein [Bacillota bacterium]|nr:DUF3794 domain-containing protein [Bacillota bacterium]